MSPISKIELNDLLAIVAERGASDLHIGVGKPPLLRIDSKLVPISEREVLTPDTCEQTIYSLISEAQIEKLKRERELDFSYSFKDQARFRVNVYYQKGFLAAALRLIPARVKTLEELNLPIQLKEFTRNRQGLFLSVGPAGHGKTTTVAAMIDIINHERQEHIITIEDPIEYTFAQDKCLVDQREVYHDTNSFPRALRAALRQDPDVVMVGEMRDLETISTALTLAETGHMIFSTLHTNNAPETIDRIVDVFPPYQQNQVRFQLANTLTGIVSQRLLPRRGGGRIIITEIMKTNSAIKNLIREGKTYQISSIIQTGSEDGMVPLDKMLSEYVKNGEISEVDAYAYANDQHNLQNLLKG